MGLDRNGFTKKTYSDLLDEMQAKFKELFGEDINLSSYTPLGIIMRVMAFFFSVIWNTTEAVYNSRWIKKADGVSLDYHGGDKQLLRDPATHSYVVVEITGEPGFIIQSEELATTEGEIQFAFQEDVELDATGKATAELISTETGAFTRVLPNTVTKLVEPASEITSIHNPQPAYGGSDIESDSAYRKRLLKANESKGKATAGAVELAVLNTPGVRSANVIFNRKNEVDLDGNPPKSIHAYVLGGTKEDIAESLYDSVGATTETVGEQVVSIKDLSGNLHEVRFDYASVVPIYIRVSIKTNTDFPAEGESLLKDALVEAIGGIDSMFQEHEGLAMGTDVSLSKLYITADKIPGIEDTVFEIGIDKLLLEGKNIKIPRKQVAETLPSLIEVILSA